ncbi:MAG: DUF507 family protein [Deltaproteobacteria bacterium]|nr:DUF507 family protein [Deltaproteobacteria bacterium]MBN2671699.1 DUF507 family protein [Deltaproteobacteria bacterium]
MKLFSGKVDIIAAEITQRLLSGEAIETDSPQEVELDIASVLKEYIRRDKHFTESAKDICERQGLPYNSFPKIKRQLAKKENFVIGDEAIDYLMDQIIGVFMHSQFVDEIFSEDHELKVIMRDVLRKHTDIEDEIDEEARKKIRNLKEGTNEWEIEYKRAMEQVKKRRKLS